jgi:hypothetical protein
MNKETGEKKINSELEVEFNLIKEFGKDYPDILKKINNCVRFSDQYYSKLFKNFISGRGKIEFKKSETTPDKAVYYFIQQKGFKSKEIEKIKKYHIIAMAVENKIGLFLEEYIYNKIKNLGWVWCSGNVVKSIDFIKKNKNDSWEKLQVKNSKNSENSSSNKVREDTDIKHWFRRFHTTGKTNWELLNEIMSVKYFSEIDFLKFLKNKAKNLTLAD